MEVLLALSNFEILFDPRRMHRRDRWAQCLEILESAIQGRRDASVIRRSVSMPPRPWALVFAATRTRRYFPFNNHSTPELNPEFPDFGTEYGGRGILLIAVWLHRLWTGP